MTTIKNPAACLRTERVLSASPGQVFAAFEQPEVLARWWGPAGFTNTFSEFDFRPGGQWIFVMHGPDGVDYANESIFQEIERDRLIVLDHTVEPLFTLIITLTAQGDRTHLDWVGEFTSQAVADSLRAFCGPANEQLLDRLEAVLAGRQP